MEYPSCVDTSKTRKIKYPCGHTPLQYWVTCPDCGKERWVSYSFIHYRKGEYTGCCPSCAYKRGHTDRRGKKHYNWKGGRFINYAGYILQRLSRDHKFASMCDPHGYVLEHRLVMAEHLGRALPSAVQVHHKNKDKQDNRIENLRLSAHDLDSVPCPHCGKYYGDPILEEIRLPRTEEAELYPQTT